MQNAKDEGDKKVEAEREGWEVRYKKLELENSELARLRNTDLDALLKVDTTMDTHV